MAKGLKKGEIPGTQKQFDIFAANAMTVAFLCYCGLKDVHQAAAPTASEELLYF